MKKEILAKLTLIVFIMALVLYSLWLHVFTNRYSLDMNVTAFILIIFVGIASPLIILVTMLWTKQKSFALVITNIVTIFMFAYFAFIGPQSVLVDDQIEAIANRYDLANYKFIYLATTDNTWLYERIDEVYGHRPYISAALIGTQKNTDKRMVVYNNSLVFPTISSIIFRLDDTYIIDNDEIDKSKVLNIIQSE